MVSFIRAHSEPIRPHPRPWFGYLVVTGVAALVAVGVWVIAFRTAGSPHPAAARTCPTASPSGDTPFGTLVPTAAPSDDPVPPAGVKVRVLNANGRSGQAATTSTALRDLGFASAEPAFGNDSYFDGNLDCRGQIRYGATGQAAAATVALAVPCMQFVRDDRTDSSVDIALGLGAADGPSTGPELRRVLAELTASAQPNATDLARLRNTGC